MKSSKISRLLFAFCMASSPLLLQAQYTMGQAAQVTEGWETVITVEEVMGLMVGNPNDDMSSIGILEEQNQIWYQAKGCCVNTCSANMEELISGKYQAIRNLSGRGSFSR